MSRWYRVAPTLLAVLALCLPKATLARLQQPAQGAAASKPTKVMREYRGVKLGLTPDQVHNAVGKPEQISENREEYKIEGDGLLTVHYENGTVKAIQLYIPDIKYAPAFTDVIGDAEIQTRENGAKHARLIVAKENFWVSMYQNKDGTVTTITISR